MEDDQPEEVERLRDWTGRLDAFTSKLDDIDGDDATDFCHTACDAWQAVAFAEPPPPATPAMLVILEALEALSNLMMTATMDYYDTPDVRDRMTREVAQQSLTETLENILRECRHWLDGRLPSAEEIKQRNNRAINRLQSAKEAGEKLQAQQEADEAQAAADPYGAILGYHDPNHPDVAICFIKICSFSEDENKRYGDAYERLRKMLDSELYNHIADTSEVFCELVAATIRDLQNRSLSLSNEDATDERRRKIRSALISYVSALVMHREQTIRSAVTAFGRNSAEAIEVKQLLDGLRDDSFGYRWLEASRDALLHCDINAFKFGFSASLEDGSDVQIYMDRMFMLDITKQSTQKKWLKRNELAARTSDPAVADMIDDIHPRMAQLQDKLDKIMYPNVARDSGVVKELIGRFNGKKGLYALQSGPGFTHRRRVPPFHRLAPRVLLFAHTVKDAASVG